MDVDRTLDTAWPDLGVVRAMKVSYAQNFEDVRLARVLPETGGFYIDVGAYEPACFSVTKWFYDRDWRGVNIEPQPRIFKRLNDARPDDVNLNVGVADRPGRLTFFEMPDGPELSTFDPEIARAMRGHGSRVVEHDLAVMTLAEICERHVGRSREIDFLKIDAEGFERPVLAGADWSRWRPRIVIVEASGQDDCGPVLTGLGYAFAAFDGINRFFVRDEDRAMIPRLAAPVGVLDDAIPYTYLRLIEERADLGPTSVALARRLRRLASFIPGLASVARRTLRAAG